MSTRKDGNIRRSYNTLVSAFYQLKENRREMIFWSKSVFSYLKMKKKLLKFWQNAVG
jgi:hypothetical protein